ncbi:MAG: urease accessory protein UreD [Rubrivivax sp.]|nr:urease accessory protein UreD [Rubrivivax sp.]
MSWHGRLALRYRREGGRTVAHDRHDGPLRVLQALYPEGEGICHHVLVHPPGGLVGGDDLALAITLEEGAHALVTTPGATRFYRSAGAAATQHSTLRLASGARLEWLPLETLAYPGCEAENVTRIELEGGAEAIGWDVLALGLPASGLPFDRGAIVQHLEVPGCWLERGRLAAEDRALLDGTGGLAGGRALATMWFVAGAALGEARRETLVEAARRALDTSAPALTAGVTAPAPGVVVLRALADRTEPLLHALRSVRDAWRPAAWGLPPHRPRLWRT